MGSVSGGPYGLAVPDPADIPTTGFDTVLGLEFLEVSGDRVVASFAVTPQLQQPYGILHGGVLCSVVETLGSVAGAVWWGDRGHVVGTSNHTDFLRAVREGTLTGTARPVHRGRTQQLWDVDITDEAGRLVARGQLRVANLSSAEGLGRS